MKLLLDENLPKKLKSEFPQHDVSTVREIGWNGLTNGTLLQKMIDDNFEALITFDKNLEHQQNFEKYPLTVIAISAESNQFLFLRPLVPMIEAALSKRMIGVTTISE